MIVVFEKQPRIYVKSLFINSIYFLVQTEKVKIDFIYLLNFKNYLFMNLKKYLDFNN